MKKLLLGGVLSLLALGQPSLAQEGYPFDGTWRGTIGSGEGMERIVLVMKYDGESLGGMINPGRNSFNITRAELDAPNWLLKVEAVTRDGKQVEFEGVLSEIGSPNRILSGTWRQDGAQRTFTASRE